MLLFLVHRTNYRLSLPCVLPLTVFTRTRLWTDIRRRLLSSTGFENNMYQSTCVPWFHYISIWLCLRLKIQVNAEIREESEKALSLIKSPKQICGNAYSIRIAINFKNFDLTVPDLIFIMMLFCANTFCSYVGKVTFHYNYVNLSAS